MSAPKGRKATPRHLMAERVADLAFEGLHGYQIAERLGISRSYAYDLWRDPKGEQSALRKKLAGGVCIDCGGPTSYVTGGPARRCRSCTFAMPHTVERSRHLSAARATPKRYTDEDLLEILRWAAAKCDGPLTTPKYDRIRADWDMPTTTTIITRLGGWQVALGRAGLPTSDAARASSFLPIITRETCIEQVVECWEALGEPPTYDKYDAWARPDYRPSVSTIRNRLGSWTKALVAAERARMKAAA